MEIRINEKWRIITDPQQFILQAFNSVDKRSGKERWGGVSYHTTLSSLISDLLMRDFRGGETRTGESLSEALERIESLSRDLESALSPLLTIEIAPGSNWQAEKREAKP